MLVLISHFEVNSETDAGRFHVDLRIYTYAHTSCWAQRSASTAVQVPDDPFSICVAVVSRKVDHILHLSQDLQQGVIPGRIETAALAGGAVCGFAAGALVMFFVCMIIKRKRQNTGELKI
ncbi:hypothetical protein DFP72DRAFT_850421 [Ephemerocybe angulata]|uniref:Uncharacterized protein n=1 Tax=Ephemerocybe angulata TaxID=980116 RepID=A0A8H6M584_9AGAR|nr:hypothetical protein DFP72DRAFT_850421 [Tulosesus angulatus]